MILMMAAIAAKFLVLAAEELTARAQGAFAVSGRHQGRSRSLFAAKFRHIAVRQAL
jgi:hypothetical protein